MPVRFLTATCFLAAITVCAGLGGPRIEAKGPAAPTRPAPKASLLTLGWDFDGDQATGWSHKENAQLSFVSEGGKKALRLVSRFESHPFTWTTRTFGPHTAAGVVHLGFRVRGDGSGHLLQVNLGTSRPNGPSRLYYVNVQQALPLDFHGWRPVTLELDHFPTPAGGLRDLDLAQVIFLEFTITAKDPRRPLDVAIGDIRFFGPTPDELAANEKRERERKQIVTELEPALAQARRQLAGLREQIDVRAREGRFVDVARLYAAALAWSADDAQRCLEAAELEIVRQAGPFLADLQKRLAEPQRVLDRILDQPPREADPYRAGENPYFKSIVAAARPLSRKETTYAKGRKGYLAVPNAWSFSGFGGALFDAAWSMTTPHSPLRHHPLLAANALDLLDTIAHQHTDGDFNVDRTAVFGRDTNINRFCLAPTLDAWWRLRQAYPDLLPAAKQADLEAGLKRLADYQLADYGLARLAREPHVKSPAYPNMDVHHILIMEFAHRLWGDPQYARERDAFVKILDAAVYPMGAFTYINTQNECFVYHHLDVVYSARFWQLTGNPTTLAMLRRTTVFYPYNVEPAGMPEYYTDPCWKHYWGGGGPVGPDVIAALTGDPLNKRVADVCGQIWGYGHGHLSAIAAELWKPLPSQPLPDGYVIHDTNIDGPRGRYGPWSFAGNGRNYGMGYQGKDTFVGGMITGPLLRGLPLDSALQVATAEVRLSPAGNHWVGGRSCSALERLSTTLGPDFGSLAVRYTVSKPNWHHKSDEIIPWDGTQAWYLSRTRLVGLVALEATADETRTAVHGRIRLGMSRTLEADGPQGWKYGRLRVKIHAHNYARIVSEPSETFFLDKPEAYRSTEITLLDPLSVKAGQNGNVKFRRGTRYWFLVEVFPDSSQPAAEVQQIEEGPVVGFSLRESDRWVAVLYNPSPQAAAAGAALPAGTGQATLYGDTSGKGKPLGQAPTRISLPAGRHLVIVAPTPARP